MQKGTSRGGESTGLPCKSGPRPCTSRPNKPRRELSFDLSGSIINADAVSIRYTYHQSSFYGGIKNFMNIKVSLFMSWIDAEGQSKPSLGPDLK
jgi:hypothetical protein